MESFFFKNHKTIYTSLLFLVLGVALFSTISQKVTAQTLPPSPTLLTIGGAYQTKEGSLSLGTRLLPQQMADVFGVGVMESLNIFDNGFLGNTLTVKSTTPPVGFVSGAHAVVVDGQITLSTFPTSGTETPVCADALGTLIPCQAPTTQPPVDQESHDCGFGNLPSSWDPFCPVTENADGTPTLKYEFQRFVSNSGDNYTGNDDWIPYGVYEFLVGANLPNTINATQITSIDPAWDTYLQDFNTTLVNGGGSFGGTGMRMRAISPDGAPSNWAYVYQGDIGAVRNLQLTSTISPPSPISPITRRVTLKWDPPAEDNQSNPFFPVVIYECWWQNSGDCSTGGGPAGSRKFSGAPVFAGIDQDRTVTLTGRPWSGGGYLIYFIGAIPPQELDPSDPFNSGSSIDTTKLPSPTGTSTSTPDPSVDIITSTQPLTGILVGNENYSIIRLELP